MYSEHKNGREEFLIWSHLFNHNTYLADWNAGVRRPIVTRHYESAEAIVRDNYSSLRGAAVLHMLRKHLGEEKWRKAIQRYVRANANRLVTTEDFRIAIEEATGESMEWFFDQWLYLEAMKERSHPVINGAANALGKSGAPGAFEALTKLMTVPSWKGENRISGMNGLKELGDPRGAAIALEALADLHSPHWTLATPIWDYRLTAAQTIAALGKSDAAFPMIFARFKTSLDENDLNDIFSNLLLLTTLADPRGLEAFDLLKAKFKTDATMMQTIGNLEAPFRKTIAKPLDGVRN
ncbi:MAG: M1 family aminopeptidase [Blastocatellia bacterium]|nr:M1 family aminopeptidase [Blastocatellia bacterium]